MPHGVWKMAVRRAIKAAGGIEAVAAALPYSKTEVGRWNNLNDRDLPSRDVMLQLDELAIANGGTAEILYAQARLLGHVAFPLPEAHGAAQEVTLQLAEATAEFGDIAQAVVAGLSDGRFDAAEQARIAGEIDDAQRALARLRAIVTDDETRLASSSAAVGPTGTPGVRVAA